MAPSGQQPEFVILRLQVVFWAFVRCDGFSQFNWERVGKMGLDIWRRGVGKKGSKREKTYGGAAEPATAGLAGDAEGVAAAGGSNRHAEWS